MPFVSVFEQEILEQKQKIDDQRRQLLDQQQLRDLNQQRLDHQQQARDTCLRGIGIGLKLKFKEEGQALFADVQRQSDLDWLRRFLDSIESADKLDDLRKLFP